MVKKSVLLGYDVGPLQCREMEAQSWVPQQRYSETHRWRDGLVKGRTGYNS